MEYKNETSSHILERYDGLGYGLFEVMKRDLPDYYKNLTFYRATSYQTEDVFAICTGCGHDYGIQLAPDCEVICLWDEVSHVVIGYWSSDEYSKSIKYIRPYFILYDQ